MANWAAFRHSNLQKLGDIWTGDWGLGGLGGGGAHVRKMVLQVSSFNPELVLQSPVYTRNGPGRARQAMIITLVGLLAAHNTDRHICD